DSGELIDLAAQESGGQGEFMPVQTIFKNTGGRTVDAQFKGEILRDGKVIQLVESIPLQVQPNEVVPLETILNIQEPGNYQIRGRVYYNNKLTLEAEQDITIDESDKPAPDHWWPLILLSALLGALMILIARARSQRSRRQRRAPS
ncbi:MAG: hypothetical protein ABIH41_03200, partial [Nanoarchaeota archaeon]